MKFKNLRAILFIVTMAVSLVLAGCGSTEVSEDTAITEEVVETEIVEDENENAENAAEAEGVSETVSEITVIEILAEIVEIEDDGTLVICDTDGNIYEMEAPADFSETEQYTVGSVLKISYGIDASDGGYEIVSEDEVVFIDGDEADEVRSMLIEKGYVIVDFDYDDVLAYYEEMYEGIIDILKYSPEKMTEAVEAAWYTEDGSEEWETVTSMEQENLQAYIDYMFALMDPNYNSSSSASAAQSNTSTSQSQTEKYTYVNNVTVEGVIQLTNEYRNSQGVASLTVDEKLQQAAQIRADELAVYGSILVNGIAHVRIDGSSWTTVLSEVGWGQGYSHKSYNENCTMFVVSSSYPAESSTPVNNWINSESHRLAMVDSKYTQIGVGVAWNGDTCFVIQLLGYLQ